MQIDDKLISYLEDLSCLTLSEGEKSRLLGDIQKILDYMARLGELDTAGVSERSHPWDCCASRDIVNAFRDDKIHPSFDRELILKNAPVKNDEMFIAPGVIA